MKEFDELNDFGSKHLVKAINNCSEATKQEITEELRKLKEI